MIIEEYSFEKAFLAINKVILYSPEFVGSSRMGDTFERIALSYRVNNPTSYEFFSDKINRISKEYAETFWDFMISGKANVNGEFRKWPGVQRFFEKKEDSILPDNFNSLYGPRIVGQLDCVMKELVDHPDTRRAVLHILSPEDQILLDADETIEYPCTVCMTYFIRKGKLYGHCIMRSQNTAVVLQLDMYLQGRLLCYIAKLLGLEVGTFICTMTSAHIYARDMEYVKSFLEEE